MRLFTQLFFAALLVASSQGALTPVLLRTEWLMDPAAIETPKPRVSWQVESATRGDRQTAYRVFVASSEAALADADGDLWDSGKVASNATLGVEYAGQALGSGERCFWKLKVWDKDGEESAWSAPARWSMGLLKPEHWMAQWISYRDEAPLHADRETLFLPPARQYRKEFAAAKAVKRATVYASALGIFELHLNGQRVGDTWFAPGWSDYRERASYRVWNVTAQLREGPNAMGAIVADGWYAGYVGHGLLFGYGPNKAGRSFYGKTPALIVQLDLEYADGTHEIVGTDASWQVTDRGPIREADLLMGESYDARLAQPDWCTAGFPAEGWAKAIRAEENGSVKATFYDTLGEREVELGFQKPKRMQAYAAPPIRVTQELPARRITEPSPGVLIYDFGQNFVGNIRLRVQGEAGQKVQLRYGEMLHPDGRLMTENLRRARATDSYILRGDAEGETWTPRFTYHGFRFVELTGLSARPALDALTGLVIHHDAPLTSRFECSDEVVTRLAQNIAWTQRASFLEVPADGPQRDERLGWLGSAQVFARTATFHADLAAFFTKWLDDVGEAQRDSGAYPDYAPYPMAHGVPGKTSTAGWADAGIICPWTMWQVYGDTRLLERHWAAMTRFMEWRRKGAPELRGVLLGNTWGDALNADAPTPLEYLDACYHALDARLMGEMAAALGRSAEAKAYYTLYTDLRDVFRKDYFTREGALKVETQTAHVLALTLALAPRAFAPKLVASLVEKLKKGDGRVTTGLLGTKQLLPTLTAMGQHDLAVRLLQSRRFASWGFAVAQGATTVWERWDALNQEAAFVPHNGALAPFNHSALASVGEWMFRSLAGIDTDGPGYQKILIHPGPPSPGSNAEEKPIDEVRAEYASVRGRIVSHWKRRAGQFELKVTIPANTTATVHLPCTRPREIRESGKPVREAMGVKLVGMQGDRALLTIESGSYEFSTPVD